VLTTTSEDEDVLFLPMNLPPNSDANYGDFDADSSSSAGIHSHQSTSHHITASIAPLEVSMYVVVGGHVGVM